MQALAGKNPAAGRAVDRASRKGLLKDQDLGLEDRGWRLLGDLGTGRAVSPAGWLALLGERNA